MESVLCISRQETRVHGTCGIDVIRGNEQELTLKPLIIAEMQNYNLSTCCLEIKSPHTLYFLFP